uniref:Uncharacterized protein n=1 Tax=Romanomermis culicivorax TaxID=13658 RepID=A0A915HWB1_ROMCU
MKSKNDGNGSRDNRQGQVVVAKKLLINQAIINSIKWIIVGCNDSSEMTIIFERKSFRIRLLVEFTPENTVVIAFKNPVVRGVPGSKTTEKRRFDRAIDRRVFGQKSLHSERRYVGSTGRPWNRSWNKKCGFCCPVKLDAHVKSKATPSGSPCFISPLNINGLMYEMTAIIHVACVLNVLGEKGKKNDREKHLALFLKEQCVRRVNVGQWRVT